VDSLRGRGATTIALEKKNSPAMVTRCAEKESHDKEGEKGGEKERKKRRHVHVRFAHRVAVAGGKGRDECDLREKPLPNMNTSIFQLGKRRRGEMRRLRLGEGKKIEVKNLERFKKKEKCFCSRRKESTAHGEKPQPRHGAEGGKRKKTSPGGDGERKGRARWD